MHMDLEQRPRLKKPYVTTLDQVTITREPEAANIDYHDPGVGSVHLVFGFSIDGMTDQEILDVHNNGLWAVERRQQENPYFAEEVPVGQPQIEYYDRGDQWSPVGSVLRCIVSDSGPDYETSVWVDDRELSLREFGRLLSTYNGWGMRIAFVPDDEIEWQPKIRPWRQKSTTA